MLSGDLCAGIARAKDPSNVYYLLTSNASLRSFIQERVRIAHTLTSHTPSKSNHPKSNIQHHPFNSPSSESSIPASSIQYPFPVPFDSTNLTLFLGLYFKNLIDHEHS